MLAVVRSVQPVTGGRVLWAVIVVCFSSIPLALTGWAFLDAAHRPQWAWALSRHRQVVWMAAILFGVLCGGLFISGWYLIRIRPALRAIEGGDFSAT